MNDLILGLIIAIGIILFIVFAIYMVYLQIAALYRTRRLNDIYHQLEEIKMLLAEKSKEKTD